MGGRLIHGIDLYTGKYGIWNLISFLLSWIFCINVHFLFFCFPYVNLLRFLQESVEHIFNSFVGLRKYLRYLSFLLVFKFISMKMLRLSFLLSVSRKGRQELFMWLQKFFKCFSLSLTIKYTVNTYFPKHFENSL